MLQLIISQRVCSWQAFFACINISMQGQEPTYLKSAPLGRLSLKHQTRNGLSGTNDLANFTSLSLTKKKSFHNIELCSQCYKTFFSLPLMMKQIIQSVFLRQVCSQLGQAKAYHLCGTSCCALIGKAQALLSTIGLGCIKLPGLPSLFCPPSVTKKSSYIGLHQGVLQKENYITFSP